MHTLKIPLIVDCVSDLILEGQSRICNWAYNSCLEMANDLRSLYIETQDPEIGKILYTKTGLRDHLVAAKNEFLFLKTVHSSPLKNSILRLSESIRQYQNSKKGIRVGSGVKWPNYRSSKKFFSLYYDEPNKGFKIEGDNLFLSLGTDEFNKRIKVHLGLKTSLTRFKNLEIRNLRITKEGKDYFACFCVERTLPQPKKIKKWIALDPNHKNLSFGVDNQGKSILIENPYFVKSLEKRIDQLKSRRDRCLRKSIRIEENDRIFYLPSRKYQFFDNLIDKARQKLRDQKKQYLYSVCNKLYKEYDLVAIGSYTPRGGGINKGMRRSMNNYSLIGKFKESLSWVSLRGGKKWHEWSEYNTTKKCSTPKCSFQHENSLSPQIRKWTCPKCLQTHIRDENAAQNGFNKTKKELKLPCSGRQSLVKERRVWRFDGLGIQFHEFRGSATLVEKD